MHRPPLEERGEAAIVGIIDTGVDILHEAFRDGEGTTRILALWDQRDPTGPSPHDVDTGFSQRYGTLHPGAHDGSTLLETAFEAITSGGRELGIAVVKSAGNERGHGGHASIRPFGIMPIAWISSAMPRPFDYFEAWYDGMDDLAFIVRDPAKNTPPADMEVSFERRSASYLLRGNLVQVRLVRGRDGGDNCLMMTIKPVEEPIQPGRWELEVRARRIGQGKPLHIWVQRMDSRAVRFEPEDPDMTLSIPGTARAVITVGACDTGATPRLLPASSWGSTRDGRDAPDIVAPGVDVISAHAFQSDTAATVAIPGTSMAAPFVTGALALAMSRRAKSGQPQFSQEHLRNLLRYYNKGMNAIHNPGFGFGVLDASAFLTKLEDEP